MGGGGTDNNATSMGYRCEKHQVDVSEENPTCKDPELYCKFRPSCIIHFLERERKKEK